MFDHCPGDGKPVKGTGSPADLIQHQKAVSGSITQDICYLGHLHHKGTLAAGQIIRSSHTGKDPVADADLRLLSRHKASQLSHKDDQRHLAHIGGFSRHIRAGYHGKAVLSIVQEGVICHKQIVPHHLFHHRMAAVFDVDHTLFVDGWLYIVAAGGYRGKRTEHIRSRNGSGRLLDPHHLRGDGVSHTAEQVVFQGYQFLLSSQDHILQLL